MEIVKHPNEILKTKCIKIATSDKEVIQTLHAMRKWVADDANNALGLALPQVGISKQGFAFCNISTGRVEIAINPIIKKKLNYGPSNEGCLSIPGVSGTVARAKEIHVLYFNDKMKPVQQVFYNKTARIFQHEFDHLQGILFTELEQLEPIEESE